MALPHNIRMRGSASSPFAPNGGQPELGAMLLGKVTRTVVLFALTLLLAMLPGAETTAVGKNRKQNQKLLAQERLELEQLLSDLGYWTGSIDGTVDPASRHALVAFQKVEGRPRTGQPNRSELEALRRAGKPLPKHSGYPHVEIDIGRQVLFVVSADDSITHILPVCTGNEQIYMDHGQVHRAHTPKGQFKVLRQIAGWRKSSLGLLYYPSYIHEGIAIHGSLAVATEPASHGCIRIPMFAARKLSEMTPVGTDVVVY